MSLSYEQIQGALVQLPLAQQRRMLAELEQRLARQDSPAVNGAHLQIELPDPEPNQRWLEQMPINTVVNGWRYTTVNYWRMAKAAQLSLKL